MMRRPKSMRARLALLLSTISLSVGLTATMAPTSEAAGQSPKPQFDLQAHRGGIGLTVENTLAAFSRALEVGVSTLELDVQITQDGRAVVTHDRRVDGTKCRDTKPASKGDEEYPYVGKYINTLTFRQVRTLDCGSRTLPAFPRQAAAPGARMPELKEVFALVRRHRASGVQLNIETKIEAAAPEETAPRTEFVRVVAREVHQASIGGQVLIQSFDWGALMLMSKVAPDLPIVALTNRDFLQVGQRGTSPWLGGIDVDDFGGNLVRAASSFGADAISPVHGFPSDGGVGDRGYRPYVTNKMVRQAHRAGLEVIPWTVDDRATMRALMDKGVDGIITDYPDRLRSVMAERGLERPARHPAPTVREVAARTTGAAEVHRRPCSPPHPCQSRQAVATLTYEIQPGS